MIYQTLLLLLIPILTASAAQVCFKKGVSQLGNLELSFNGFLGLILKILQNGWLIGGILLMGISFLFYLSVLSKFQLNIAYPVLVSAGVILIAISSWLFFEESLSLPQILGIVAIISGIFLLLTKY